MSKIGQGSLNPAITPISIFLRHPSDQCRNLSGGSRLTGGALGAAIVLLGDQLSMPRQQCFRSHGGFELNPHIAALIFLPFPPTAAPRLNLAPTPPAHFL